MSKTIVASLLPALAVAFTLSLQAEPAWTTEDVAPNEWTALSCNLLYGLIGTKSGTITTGYGTDSMSVLTDGVVPKENGNESRVAFQNTGAVEWSFPTPKKLEQVRVSGCYLGGSTYTRISISAVYVKLFGSDTWTALDGSGFLDNSGRSQNVVICASLADSATGYLAQGVAGLKVVFGANVPLASYIVEIEAVGSAETTGPVVGAFDIAPAKTKAKVSGTIADVGTDATACDIYFALDGGAATKIAEGVTGSFEYQIQGLTAGMTYAYELSVSNNAATAKGTVRNGEFTTLSASDSTVVWTTGSFMPDVWCALEGNVLSNMRGTMDISHTPNSYGTNDLIVLTDGCVPSAAGKDWIVGILPNAEIDWNLSGSVTLERLRISSSYLADPHFSGVNIASVKVKCVGSDEWVEVPGSSSGKVVGDGTTGNIICATLSDAENGCIAQNVVALKVVFGPAVYVNANYYAEIEAVGHAERKKGGIVIVY